MKPIDINQYQLDQEIQFTNQSLKSGIVANIIYMVIYLAFGLWWALANNLIGAMLYHHLSKLTLNEHNLASCQRIILTIYVIQLSIAAFILLPSQSGIHFFFLILPCLAIFFRQANKESYSKLFIVGAIGLFFIVELLRDFLTPVEVLTNFQCRFIYFSVMLFSVLNLTMYFSTFSYSLKEQNSKLTDLAMTDPLTNIYNRRYVMQSFEQRFAQWKSDNNQQTSLLIIDADHFKRVNDRFGHDIGDVVLREIATTISRSIRGSDIAGRIGGEEFCVLLSNVDAHDAKILADRIRSRVEHLSFDDHPKLKISVSIGVTTLRAGYQSYKDAYHEADNALYLAKSKGRNRCEIAH